MLLRKLRPKKRRTVLTAILFVLVVGGILFYFIYNASAWTGNSGNAAWGDTSAGTGRLRISAYTFGSPGTYGTPFRPTTAPSSSAIQFVVNKSAPTRNEKMIGYQLNNGRLYVARCVSTCTAVGNLTANSWSWATPTIVATNTFSRAFDIAYEPLSGRAMVVYAGNQTGYLFYCIWDGTSWGPVSSCTPTVGTNSIALTDGTTSLTGTPAWVTLKAYGDQQQDSRSNDILLAVQDSNNDIFVTHWNGSSWLTTDRQVLTTTGGATVAETQGGSVEPQSFDVGWESTSGLEMAVYANGTTLQYRTSTGSGWSSATTIATYATAAQWVKLGSDPISNRMSLITAFGSTGTAGSTATGTRYIWKSDGTTVGWTASTALTMNQDAGQNISTVWEKAHGGTPQALFTSGASANTNEVDASSWTQSGGFTTWAELSTTSANDIIVGNEMVASPNSDIVALLQADRDGDLRTRTYSGSAWSNLITTNMTTTLINEETTRGTNRTAYIQKAYQFAYKPYAPWSMNWQVFNDVTDATPNSAIANEDTEPAIAPSEVVRLRANVAELGGQGETADTNGVRVKLQYSSGAGCPDSTGCSWTDVGASGSGSIWRYNTSSGMTDDGTFSTMVLDGSTVGGEYFTNGTASAPNAIQAAGTKEEYDFTLQNNGSTVGTDYYFRLYDYGASTSGGSMTNLGPIYREQIKDINGNENTDCTDGTTALSCTYPTLLSYSTAPNPPQWQTVPNGTTTPALQLSAADGLGNALQYTIEWCPVNSFPCASGGGTFDQTASQSGWSGQDSTCNSLPNTCYAGNININNSTVATYTVPPGIFAPSTTYYLRAKAIDPPPGLNAYGTYSSTTSLTTGSLQILINGGTCIGFSNTAGTTACGPTTGTNVGNVQIGN